MASYVTLQTLITRVRQRTNLENATTFVTDAEITDCLNVSLANEVYDLLRQNVGDNYYRKKYTFTTIQGQYDYGAPGDLLAIISVDVWFGGQFPYSARRYAEAERNMLRGIPFGWGPQYPLFYRLQGSGVGAVVNLVSGTPLGGVQVDLNYVPVMPPLVNTNDIFDDINGWSEIAVLDAGVKVCIKDGSFDTAQFLEARKAAMIAKVRAMGPQRHAGEPETVNILAGRTELGDGWLD